ncbi:Uncharacterised protein [Mycobacteroides abscessus subsp. abscessus]|nr:Uncharacterised protein [Mycobacteroides abscessus subsp. abscessus]
MGADRHPEVRAAEAAENSGGEGRGHGGRGGVEAEGERTASRPGSREQKRAPLTPCAVDEDTGHRPHEEGDEELNGEQCSGLGGGGTEDLGGGERENEFEEFGRSAEEAGRALHSRLPGGGLGCPGAPGLLAAPGLPVRRRVR